MRVACLLPVRLMILIICFARNTAFRHMILLLVWSEVASSKGASRVQPASETPCQYGTISSWRKQVRIPTILEHTVCLCEFRLDPQQWV